MEAEGLPLGLWDSVPGAHHMPVVLYLAPVALAALAYGWEGGILTGLWSAALASVNVIVWHSTNFEWTLELAFVAIVVGMGVAMSLPVERERRQRQRAEEASGRLGILNDLATSAISASTPVQSADAVLDRLMSLLEVEAVGVCLWRPDEAEPLAMATRGRGLALPMGSDSMVVPSNWERLVDEDAPVVVSGTPIATENILGYLAVATDVDRPAPAGIGRFLATAGSQLAVRVENAMLLELERSTMATYIKLVAQAQEEERRRLARDLHDGPAQQLAVLVRRLEPGGSLDARAVGDLHQTASETLRELRRVARDQRPTLLDDLGLVPALEWLASELRNPAMPEITFEVRGDVGRLPSETEVAFYRVAQEALNNAVHHSGASTLRVELHFDSNRLELVVTDDGVGFEVPETQSGFIHDGGLGVMGMHERADLIGGTLEVSSSPGEGTVVHLAVEVPCE